MTKAPARRIRVEEAAEYLGIAVDTLNQMRSRGDGPRFIKIGGKTGRIVLYDTGDLDDWLESNKYRSTAEFEKCAVGGKLPMAGALRQVFDGGERLTDRIDTRCRAR